MPKHLLITGGSGYLGSHLIRHAQASWRTVGTYFSQPSAPTSCQMVNLDIGDSAAVARVLTGLNPEVVIHTAADMSSVPAMQEVIVAGTRNVAAACSAIGARLVHISTDVLFDGEHAPYIEGDPPSPITPYGRAKAAAEQIVADLCPDAAIVRTSLIYGFAPPDPRTWWVLDSVRHGEPITLFTDELRCPVWVEQLAEALLELADSEQGGVWHLAAPQALSRYEFGERLVRAYSLDPCGIIPGRSHESSMLRPRDCRLDVSKAQSRLRSPFWGAERVLEQVGPQYIPQVDGGW